MATSSQTTLSEQDGLNDEPEGSREMAGAIEKLLKEREKELARSLYRDGVSIEQLANSLAISEAEIRAACGLASK